MRNSEIKTRSDILIHENDRRYFYWIPPTTNALIQLLYNLSETNDSAGKLQNHLKLLKNEYSKLQKTYVELQRKFDDLQAKSSNDPAGDNSSFNSRLVMVVTSLYGRKTYSDLSIKLKEKNVPAHKFVLQAR